MKKMIRAGLAVLGLSVALVGCSGSSSSKGNVAKVNETYISQEDFDKNFETVRNMVYASYPDDQLDLASQNGLSIRQQLSQQVRADMVRTELLKQAVEENKLEVSEEMFQKEKQGLIESMGGEEAFKAQLEATKVSEEEMDKVIRNSLYEKTLKDWFFEKNARGEEEVQSYLEENKDSLITYDVSHILVETEDEAKDAKKRIDEGEDFASLAGELSIDPSASTGGSLGEVTMQTNFVPEFLEAMSKLDEGEVSEPVKSQFGYHIIKVNSKLETAEELNDKIQENLLGQEFINYLSDLYTKANIEYYYPAEEPSNKENTESETKTEPGTETEADTKTELETESETESE